MVGTIPPSLGNLINLTVLYAPLSLLPLRTELFSHRTQGLLLERPQRKHPHWHWCSEPGHLLVSFPSTLKSPIIRAHRLPRNFASNTLTGGIPPAVGGMAQLRVLYERIRSPHSYVLRSLSHNQLAGPLPPTISLLRQLTGLFANICSLARLCSLKQLFVQQPSQRNPATRTVCPHTAPGDVRLRRSSAFCPLLIANHL